ncbi:hypothetical protein ACJX0J_017747, partial [Zea mays]
EIMDNLIPNKFAHLRKIFSSHGPRENISNTTWIIFVHELQNPAITFQDHSLELKSIIYKYVMLFDSLRTLRCWATTTRQLDLARLNRFNLCLYKCTLFTFAQF